MRRFPGWMSLSMALLAIFAVPASWASSVDQKLLSLVPPGAEVVAGMDTPPPKDQPGSFVLITRNNTVDLQDFFALTGVDSRRSVRHAIFVAMHGETSPLGEHSMMAHGQFDQARIYKSAVDDGAIVTRYRGIPVVEIEPFAREQAEFHDSRWLAIVDSDLLLFGTVASVRQELDRDLDRSAADPVLTREVARLRHDDETWCVLSSAKQFPEIEKALAGLDPKLGELVGTADDFQFGIRYRKQVEFEYEATTATTRRRTDSLRRSLAGPEKGASLLAAPVTNGEEATARGVIKIPLGRFGNWLREASASEQSVRTASQ
ncbi:MAG TPA: hypothetical protein VKH40_13595 [Alloacidobacterium sp.]|nr:hypothetical protein [Alloacidobacterium sp.]